MTTTISDIADAYRRRKIVTECGFDKRAEVMLTFIDQIRHALESGIPGQSRPWAFDKISDDKDTAEPKSWFREDDRAIPRMIWCSVRIPLHGNDMLSVLFGVGAWEPGNTMVPVHVGGKQAFFTDYSDLSKLASHVPAAIERIMECALAAADPSANLATPQPSH